MAAKADPNHRLLVVALDADFYRQAHHDLTYAEIDPPRHYDLAGWREGRDPAPWFSTEAYLELNPDVAEAGINPFVHYLASGVRQGREIAPSARADEYYALVAGEGPARITPKERAAAAELFDARFYLAMNHDVAQSGADPLDHYLRSGWREGRDPSYAFSTADYLELNPDVAAGGAHPFIHYVMTGRDEGRAVKVETGFRPQVLAKLKPFEARLADSRRWAQPVEVLPAARLTEAMAGSSRHGLHLTFSQDDYSRSVGGSQLCVQREAAEFAEKGRNHLHVHPANGWPTVRQGATETPMGVLWNGQPVGAFVPAAIAEALRAATLAGPRSFAIHNMLGHSSRDVVDIVRSAGMNAGFFWLHDMGALCAGVHLMRNDVENCGAPPQGSPACRVCVYGPARAAHVHEHQRLFERLELTVAAPSEVALQAWRAGSDLDAAGAVVLPHARLVAGVIPVSAQPKTGTDEHQIEQETPERVSETQARMGPGLAAQTGMTLGGEPFRFAFPGTPSVHKGWPIFQHLAARFAGDARYEFIHLASKPVAGSLAMHHPVTVTADEPLAMRAAMLELSVDAAMVWSLCLETFSFAAYEAASAGAAVVTGPDSGNVAAFALESGLGLVLPDERELEAWFESGEILKLARAVRQPQLYELDFSKLTAELVEAA